MKKNWVKKKEIRVGLDIGTRLIKALEISVEGDTRQLTKFHFVKVDFPLNREKTRDALKALLNDFHPTVKEVDISLSSASAMVRFIDMPKMKTEDLKNSLQFEAEKYIPFNIEEVIIDASILEEATTEKNQMKVLLAAAKKDAVNFKLELLKEMGLSVGIIDIDSFACFNAFSASFGNPDESKSKALLNIGYTQTNVVIFRGDKPFFTRDIQIGGKDIAKIIARDLQIEEKESDIYIFDPKDKTPQDLVAAKSVLSNLADEIRLSFGYYENQYARGIDEIFISGGVARLAGILDYLEESFGVKPLRWNPFSKFEIAPDLDRKSLEVHEPQFAVCAGLAIRK